MAKAGIIILTVLLTMASQPVAQYLGNLSSNLYDPNSAALAKPIEPARIIDQETSPALVESPCGSDVTHG